MANRQAIAPGFPLTVYVNETSSKNTIAPTVYINESVTAPGTRPKMRFTQVIWFDPYGY